MSLVVLVALHAITLAYAFVGGVFMAFSDFIMRSLAKNGDVGVMQTINIEVFRWVFMAMFIGLAPLSAVLVAYSTMYVDGVQGWLMILAGLTYLIGCFGVTIRCNVPMNETLAAMDLSQQETRAYWENTYLPRWTFWNTVRTLACGLSAAMLVIAV